MEYSLVFRQSIVCGFSSALLAPNALGVKLRLAAIESHPRTPPSTARGSHNSWLDRPRTEAA